jgi:tRNA A37 threonylcarbamoyladenosine modification protein TsaB
MKLLFVAVVLAVALAATFEHKNGDDVLKRLQGGNNEVYVVMFTAGDNKGEAVKKKAKEYETALSGVQNKYPQFTYTTIDATNSNYKTLVDAISLIVSELEKSPSVLIMHKGNGEWIHGPQTISKIFEFAPAYLQRMNSAK